MSFLAGQSELVFRADEMQVFSGQRDLTGAGFSSFWADRGAQRRRRVFIRTPCGVQGELTNGWLSRPRAITFRRKNCVAAAQASESIVKIAVLTHGGHMVAHVVSGRAK